MRILLTVSLLLLLSVGAWGQGEDAARKYFGDTVLLDQSGKQHRFYSDLMAGKVVVISAFHTDCTGGGVEVMKTVEALESQFKKSAGEINFISVTVDPTDTVEKARAYAAKFHAGPNRYFLTGDKASLTAVLKKLGLYVENKKDHNTLLLIGNLKTGLWKKAFGLANREELATIIESVVNDKE